MAATATKNLGIKGYHGIELALFDAEPWIEWFTDGFGFQHIATNTQENQDETGTKMYLMRCNDIRFILCEPIHDGSCVKGYLDRHPEGIVSVNYWVEDIEFAHKTLTEREAAVINPISERETASGKWRSMSIATAIGEVEYGFVELSGDPDDIPGFERIRDFDPDFNPLGITHIDHLTTNVRTLQPLISFYKTIMGMEEFWRVQFHTDDIKPGVGSGLKSIVAWDPESGIKLANNEPLAPRFNESQIEIFVKDNRGPGIQHVAFGVSDILSTIDACQDKNIDFLPTPSAYYDAIPERAAERDFGKIDEPIEELQKRSLLIDGENGGYLLQIFCKEQAVQFNRPDAGPLFIEIIQRKGCDGFGEGNFRALFESIEREQEQTKEWKATARAEQNA